MSTAAVAFEGSEGLVLLSDDPQYLEPGELVAVVTWVPQTEHREVVRLAAVDRDGWGRYVNERAVAGFSRFAGVDVAEGYLLRWIPGEAGLDNRRLEIGRPRYTP